MIADDQQYHPQDERQNYQQYDIQDGFARQNSGSFHGYAVQDNMKYDDEPLVSVRYIVPQFPLRSSTSHGSERIPEPQWYIIC